MRTDSFEPIIVLQLSLSNPTTSNQRMLVVVITFQQLQRYLLLSQILEMVNPEALSLYSCPQRSEQGLLTSWVNFCYYSHQS